ncbi:MAG: endonuclease MutS2 [candidate division KSB1 bacterium]|nr:endonuclease MutS2 [candidate division KSB1 bacterium]MDZ7275694.1 endonuclease MutS2 [candidate division KSB1 bacterium]MDZ7284615.1 endonuclease MutS2 [candidate division KSB1 bacterium]MDZ7297966.1 endonuclease MutS2 [candidate division KSB1 bacterium]MDZ7305866.1 endonuclease MutS2 [candidate division KSB1 bacterium]
MTVSPPDSFPAAAAALELPKVLTHAAAAALSAAGAETLLHLQPLPDLPTVQAHLAEVTEMRRLLETEEAFPLSSLPDLRDTLQHLRIPGRTLAIPQLIDIARFSATARRVRHYLLAHREQYPELVRTAQRLTSLQEHERALENALNFTEGTVKDSASPVLARLRREIAHALAEARTRLERIARKLAAQDMLREQMITLREGRLVLMLKEEHRRHVPGLVHDHSASGRTVFLEPMESVESNNRVRELQSAEREEIERILQMLTERLRQVLPALLANHEAMIAIDVIHAKARFARQLDANAPQMLAEAKVKLINARHPLLLLKNDDQRKVVPLDLELGLPAATPVHTLLISGPNAGGKTVALKTVGLLALMARCGLHIPASPDSMLPLFENVFVDIGDRQSIEDDLSTFTSHVKHLVEILHRAGSGDLVLIDEIGAGTDPEAGAALAVAILRELNRRGCLTIVTTHHGALKTFAQEEPGVSNGSMAFDRETLTPTYQFRAGLPGASYAFEIAERMGMPAPVIAAARSQAGAEKVNVEELLNELQNQLAQQQQLNEKLQMEEARLRSLQKLYEEREQSLKAQVQEIKKRAQAEAEALLQNANAIIENTVREIRESNAAREAIKAGRENLAALRQQLAREKQCEETPPAAGGSTITKFEIGMPVKWLKQDALATVLELPDASGKVLVAAGALRARVPAAELRAVATARKSEPATLPKANVAEAPRHAEIDLRGLRVEEALAMVDKFLDDALLAGWHEVRLIHGKGTGALRQSIANHLKTLPHVKSSRLGQFGEGDLGVTVVELV